MNTSLPDPLVTVVVPAYNARQWISFTLESVRAQTLRDIEIVVVDDGSSDGTADLAEEFAKRDSRIRVVRQSNAGVGAARNAGILAARGKYIAPLDSDDVWDPRKLEKQVECMERSGESTGMVYCHSWFLGEDGSKLAHQANFVSVTGFCRKRLIYSNFLVNASVPLFRAEALQLCGLYLTREEQLGGQGCEDWDLALRVAERWETAVVPERLVGYRQVATCMSAGGSGMTKSFRVALKKARKRNSDLPKALFNWSESNFYCYMVRNCFDRGDYRASFMAAVHAIYKDKVAMLNPRMHRTMLGCLIRLGKARLPDGGRWKKDLEAAPCKAGPMRQSPRPRQPLDRVLRRLQNRIVERRLQGLVE